MGSNYRAAYFKAHPGINGKYQCCKCRGWFPKSQIDVDHILPKRLGGTDDLSNLQALCQHCNRSKGDDLSVTDLGKSLFQGYTSGNLDKMAKGVAKQKLKDVLGIKYKR